MSQSELNDAAKLFADIESAHKEIESVLNSKLKDDGNQEKFLEELYSQKAVLIDNLIKFDNSAAGAILRKEHSEFRDKKLKEITRRDKELLSELQKIVKGKASDIRNLTSRKSLLIYSKERIK